jgi:predicted aspartyl protease
MPQVKISSFTTVYSGLSNILFNDVLISQAFKPTTERINSQKFQTKNYRAIWDTGATGTVITKKAVEECDLKSIGIIEVKTTKGSFKTNSYLVNIWLPNRVMVANVNACLGEVEGADVLIGMNIISRGDFAVTNKAGKTVFSFRLPSVECIDFVSKPFKPKPTKIIPRGKKFRH